MIDARRPSALAALRDPARRPPALRTLSATLLAVTVMALMLSGCSSWSMVGASESRILTATHVEGERYVIRTRNGAVTVAHEPERSDVLIEAEVAAYGSTMEEARARLLEAQVIANHDTANRVLEIYAEFPDGAPKPNDKCQFTIRTPSVNGLDITTSNGAIEIRGLSGDAELRTSNGRITVIDHAGPVVASSSNGAINITNARDAVTADTSNGRIELTAHPSLQAPFNLDTSNGAISVLLPSSWSGEIDSDTSNGSINIGAFVSQNGGAIAYSGSRSSKIIRVNTGAEGGPAPTRSVVDTSNGVINVNFFNIGSEGTSAATGGPSASASSSSGEGSATKATATSTGGGN